MAKEGGEARGGRSHGGGSRSPASGVGPETPGWRKGTRASEAAAWFRLGAQGPDIFYHNQRTRPSGLHYGALAHRRNYGLAMEAMCAALIEGRGASAAGRADSIEGRGARAADRTDYLEGQVALDSPEAAWLIGFATHAAVDRIIHPFIVYFSGWQIPLMPETARYRSCHPFLERLLDIDILEELRGLPVGACDLEALLPLDEARLPDGPDAGIGRLLASGLRAAFPGATGADFLIEQRIQNALADTRHFLRVTNPSITSSGSASLLPWLDDRSGWRSMALIYPERSPEGMDVGNKGRRVWEHPAADGRRFASSHGELFAQAIEKAAAAAALVASTLDSGRVEAGFAASIGNGGLSVTDGDGLPVPPRLSKPLRLKELMEAEFQRRVGSEREWTRRSATL